MNNPCINGRNPEETVCPFVAKDKNHEPCLNCLAKLEYAVNQGMFSPEVLEQKEDPVILEAREKAVRNKPGRPQGSTKEKKNCSTPKCRWDAKIKGKCRSCYGKAYREAKKLKKEGGPVMVVEDGKGDKVERIDELREKIKEFKTTDVVIPTGKEEKRCKCKPGCTAKVKARGLCSTAYARWKYQNPEKVRHYSKVASGEKVMHFDVRLQARAELEKHQLLEKAAEIARLQYRTIQNQIFFWIKEGIERWKEKKDAQRPDST